MIFVTVGTHEQPFNRLLQEIDKLIGENVINEEVIIQTGFSTYEPENAKWQKLFSYQEMIEYVAQARIVITHGGPSSFIMPLQVGKTPVVVPRKKEFGEHVNDHQVEFSKTVAERQKNIIVVENVSELKRIILDYDNIVKSLSTGLKSNNASFNENLIKIVDDLFIK